MEGNRTASLPDTAASPPASPRRPSTTTTVHSGATPVSTSASSPLWRNRTPKRPPALLSKIVPVRGDGATAAKRPELGAVVPVRGPAASTNGCAGSSAGSPGDPKRAASATP